MLGVVECCSTDVHSWRACYYKYNTIIMIGDGITDLEAVQVRGLQ
jgi:2-hydroxy-3-keto-5-methylthiopentenyl-1-phosphate phosphatase